MYRSAFVKRVLEVFIGFYGNLRDFYENFGVYKKLVRKNFFNKMLGVAFSSSPKRNQITLYRQPIYRETSVSSRLRFPQPTHLSTELSTIHISLVNYPQLIHNFAHNLSTDHLLLFITDQFFQSFLSP